MHTAPELYRAGLGAIGTLGEVSPPVRDAHSSCTDCGRFLFDGHDPSAIQAKPRFRLHQGSQALLRGEEVFDPEFAMQP